MKLPDFEIVVIWFSGLWCGVALAGWMWSNSYIQGYRVEPIFGGNCVVAIIKDFAPDYVLYCSQDINQVNDALARYRKMPLSGAPSPQTTERSR